MVEQQRAAAFGESAAGRRLAATAMNFERLRRRQSDGVPPQGARAAEGHRGPESAGAHAAASLPASSASASASSASSRSSSAGGRQGSDGEAGVRYRRRLQAERFDVTGPPPAARGSIDDDDDDQLEGGGLLETLGALRRRLADPLLSPVDGFPGGSGQGSGGQGSVGGSSGGAGSWGRRSVAAAQRAPEESDDDHDGSLSSSSYRPGGRAAAVPQQQRVDLLTVDERLAALGEEADLVKQQLTRLNNAARRRGGGPRGPPRARRPGPGADLLDTDAGGAVAPAAEAGLLVQVSGDCPVGERANAMLGPLLDEYNELAGKLARGSRMRMVVERSPDNAHVHSWCWCDVWLNTVEQRLCWAVCTDQSHSRSRSRSRDRSRDRSSSKDSFSLALDGVAAIFCGGSKEARQLSADPQTLFRVHLYSPSSPPLQFAAASAQERQDWVAGLTLLHQLLQF